MIFRSVADLVTLAGALGLGAGALLSDCTIRPRPPVGPDVVIVDAQAVDDCQAAETNLAGLACRYGDGTPVVAGDAGTWAAGCRRALDDGRNWHPGCLARIKACDQLDAAYRGKVCP